MARRENPGKIGPRSGRINPTSTLSSQTQQQIYRVYNTGDVDCSVTINNGGGANTTSIVSKGYSFDFPLPANISATLGGPDVEAIYELVPSPGLRSGLFRKNGNASQTIIKSLPGSGAVYRFFNTKKNGGISVSVIVGQTTTLNPINASCSKDIFVDPSASVTVEQNDIGVYDLLAFFVAGANVDGTVHTGHFKRACQIVSLAGSPVGQMTPRIVYRIINSGERDIVLSEGASGTIPPNSSSDVQIPSGGGLSVAAGEGPGVIQGSYEMLKINPFP